MASGKEYKLDSIEDIASLIRDIIKKRNDYHDLAVSDRYSEEIKSFFYSVESRTPPLITGKDALETVLAIEAIEYSSFTNSKVVLQ